MGVGIATIIGSLMSFGFQHYAGTLFSAWQIMFLVIGLVTISMGAVVILFLPDNPMSARALSHAEKVAAVERLRENQTGVENKHFKPYQVAQCLTDPQTCGGLLAAVPDDVAVALVARLRDAGHKAAVIGQVTAGTPHLTVV